MVCKGWAVTIILDCCIGVIYQRLRSLYFSRVALVTVFASLCAITVLTMAAIIIIIGRCFVQWLVLREIYDAMITWNSYVFERIWIGSGSLSCMTREMSSSFNLRGTGIVGD